VPWAQPSYIRVFCIIDGFQEYFTDKGLSFFISEYNLVVVDHLVVLFIFFVLFVLFVLFELIIFIFIV
jgi:hypothetical protein